MASNLGEASSHYRLEVTGRASLGTCWLCTRLCVPSWGSEVGAEGHATSGLGSGLWLT
jgi:hypothetical protein